MGAEGGLTATSLDELFEGGSLSKLLNEGSITSGLSKLIEQTGSVALEARPDGCSLLHKFALLGCYDGVKFLLEKGAKTSILKSDNSTILHSVVRTTDSNQDGNRARILSLFLSRPDGPPINQQNSKGWTALKLAARKGLERCVEVLLDHGADPSIPDQENFIALHNAVGNHVIVKLLVSYPHNINHQNEKGETSLYYATERGNKNCVVTLLEYGADPNISNSEGITPLFLAARGGNIDLVKVLLRHNAHVNCVGAAQQISPLHWAAHKEQPHIAVALIKHGADVHLKDKEGRTPLSLASPELATRMLEAAKQQNPQMTMDGSPIPSVSAEEKAMTACCGGNVQALQSLLNAGVSINYTNKDSTLTLLHMGAYCGQMGVVALLLSNGANWRIKDKDGDCVLHFACMKEAPQGNHKGTLQLLLSSPAGLLINSQNSRGDTPLLVAIRCQYSNRAKVLLRYNADAKLKNNKNELPLHRACCSDNNIGLVLELAELTSDLDVQDMDGWTPLMFAARSKSPNIVHYLLQRGVNPNLQQSVGFSALHLAVQENCLEVCQHLLKHKANPSICGGLQSLTPLHIASHKSFKDICCVLIEAGADYTLRDKDGDTPLSLTEDEEIKELITNASGQQGNNCQSRNSPILCKFSKSNEKEEMTQQVEDQQKMMSCILKDMKSLRSENEQLHSHLRACKEDLKQQELLYKMTQLSRNNSEDDIDIEACCTKWWRIQESEMEIAEEQMNTTYELFQRFFDVFKGSFRETDVAVKKVNSRFNFDADTRKTFLRDVDKLSHLHHPNLVQFMGSCMVESSGLYCVVFEYMPRGDLDAFIHHHKVELDKIPKMLIILDIASGMAYLHSFPILHRNLIPTNILLGKDLTAKISDFGFYETKVQTNFYASIRKACCKDLTNKRRPLYKAPEAIERNEFTTASDVYSFSMVMYEIVTYMKPYFDMDLCSNAMAWVMKILMGARPTLPPGLPPSCHNMINLCWNSNPAIRPSFKEFIAHCKEQIKLAREEENVTTPQNNENNDIITN